MNPAHLPRRTFLADMGMGFTGLALGAILQREARANGSVWMPPDGRPHFAPKAKRVSTKLMPETSI